VKQNAHRKSALGLGIERNRAGATAAARHLVFVSSNSSRHFSSPEAVDPVFPIARPA
jgi:hypothetical protein